MAFQSRRPNVTHWTKSWSKRDGPYVLTSITMDDYNVTEHWERLDEGYIEKPKDQELDVDDKQKKHAVDDNPANSKRHPAKKPSASPKLQSALHKRAREDKGKPKSSAKKGK